MQYLMVLLVMIGVSMLMIAALLGISYALGAFMNTRDVRRVAAGADPCAQCEADREWYEELPIWKRNAVTAWWLANRYQCAVKGCK